jgi:guanylate kinase
MHVHYRPNNEVLEHIAGVNFVGVVGPTAVGKTTVINAAAKQSPSLRQVVFTTSRQPRLGEHNGVDYHFRDRAHMEERISRGEYVNVAPVAFGDLYASAPEDYLTSGIAVAAILADVVPTFRRLPFRACHIVYIVPPNWDTWQQRIRAHGFTDEQLAKRISEAERSLEFAQSEPNLLFVINNELSVSTIDFVHLARGQALDGRQTANQSQARRIVRDLLAQLKTAA